MTSLFPHTKNPFTLNLKKYLFFLNLCLILPLSSYAQSGKFSLGTVAGLNFAPLNAEELTDYFGINAGVKSTYRLSKSWGLGIELLFSQNAEYGLPEFYPNISYQNVRLNFIEVPLQLEWFAFPDRAKSPGLTCGLAYSHLLSYYVENADGEDVSEDLIWEDQQRGINAQVGALIPFFDTWALNLRLARSLSFADLSTTLSVRLVWTFV